MLTLDRNTLFYFTLSNSSRGDSPLDLINDWANRIPVKANPGSKSRPTNSRGANTAGSTTLVDSASTHAPRVPASSRSALSNNVTISRGEDIKEGTIEIIEGRLSDRDETTGKEYEAAMKSPPKHGKRVTSEVRYVFVFTSKPDCGFFSGAYKKREFACAKSHHHQQEAQ
jgi:hypothetical protein